MEKLKTIVISALSGALAVSLAVLVYLLRNVKPVIHADQYVASLEQKVAKIKQKGEGNVQTTDVSQELTKREVRKRNRESRKAARKTVLSPEAENTEL
ncbi:MAG: hypothetical protein ACK5JD_07450 [Mangrovibacterium sp.]